MTDRLALGNHFGADNYPPSCRSRSLPQKEAWATDTSGRRTWHSSPHFVYAECLANPAYNEPWERTLKRWLDLDDVTDDRERARLRAAQLAADGLWVADAIGWYSPSMDREPGVVQLLELAV